MADKQAEYQERGDYHKELNSSWTYYPTYLAKKKYIMDVLGKESKESRILDAGAGEGVFIQELLGIGFGNVIGLDLNYQSELVQKGDILDPPGSLGKFDIVLFLDVIEHLDFENQKKALLKIKELLKDNGKLIISIPNLAHFYSRLKFLLKGELKRTADIKKHPGDRPIKEYLELLDKAGFKIEKRKGIFPTFPLCFNIILKWPGKTLWLYNFLTRFFSYPNFCFLNIIICSDGKRN